MRVIEGNETFLDTMKHNIPRMNDKELLRCGFDYMNSKDEEGKEILKLIEAEQDKRGIY